MYKILIVEDDYSIANSIKDSLGAWAFEAKCVTNFRNVIEEFEAFTPQLVLLDISLPFYNGFHWCNELRRVSRVPIIFISSASDNMNIVMAMNMGADDFLAKPFDMNVLIAKVQALLRRSYDFCELVSVLEHKGARLNTADGSFSYNDVNIPLTKNESRILLVLMQNIGRTVSREKLMQALWESDSFVDDNTLTVNINRLRKKLSFMGLNEFISTKFGVGYIIQ